MNTQRTRQERSDLCLAFGRQSNPALEPSRPLSVLTCHRGAAQRESLGGLPEVT